MSEADPRQGENGSVWRRDIISWSLYDFANTIYSMNIVSLYLKRYIVEDLGKDDWYFDVSFSASMFIAALLLPALGVISDYSTKKKFFLFLFTLTCCLAIGVIPLFPPAMLAALLVLFVIANFAYEAGQPFYNALLYSVASGKQARLVSGVGVAFGYVGSVIGMVMVLPFVTGEIFGWQPPLISAGGKLGAFVPSAVLFAAFAVPIFIWVKEKPVPSEKKIDVKQAYADVWDGIRQTKKYPGVLRYLIADYFFEDAVMTVILNIGIYCSTVIGLGEAQITLFLIVSTIAAVVGSFVIGWLAKHWRLKRLMELIVWGWVIALVLFVLTDSRWVIWLLGSLVGILMGGLWTTSRPMLAEIVPPEKLGQFFGLFSLSGRAAAFVGPLVWTLVVIAFQPERLLGRITIDIFGIAVDRADHLPYKAGVVSLAFLMMLGLYIFRKVPPGRKGLNG